MNSNKPLLTVVILLAFGALAAQHATPKNDQSPAKAYTFVASERLWDDTGKLKLSVITYEVATDGSWTSLREGCNNKKERTTQGVDYQVSSSADGSKEGRRLQFSHEDANETRTRFRSTSFLAQHNQFSGTENIFGLTGYVIKGKSSITGDIEQTFAPETGYLALRVHYKMGNGVEYRLDPISITFH